MWHFKARRSSLLHLLAEFGKKNVTERAFSLTEEDQGGAGPLQRTHGVAKQQHRAQDGEELPCGCDDGAGQGSEVDHGQENEGLARTGKTRSGGSSGLRGWGSSVQLPHLS